MNDPGHIMTFETTPLIRHMTPDLHPLTWGRRVRQPWIPEPTTHIPHGKLYARISWSRWLVDCPFCNSATEASKVHQVFWCSDCGMAQNDGAPMAVIFPPNAVDIERVLMERPDWTKRDWKPGEKLQDLIEENHYLNLRGER